MEARKALADGDDPAFRRLLLNREESESHYAAGSRRRPGGSRGGIGGFVTDVHDAPLECRNPVGDQVADTHGRLQQRYQSVVVHNRRADATVIYSGETAGQNYDSTASGNIVRVIAIFEEVDEGGTTVNARVDTAKRSRLHAQSGCQVLTFDTKSHIMPVADIRHAVHVVQHLSNRGAILLENQFYRTAPTDGGPIDATCLGYVYGHQ
jgi:hypothetical protein